MGNNLCRERIARADNSKNPIDRIIGRCAQICPANEVKPSYWQKHVLQTGPPTRTQPQPTAFDDGWRKVTLTVPNGKANNGPGGGGVDDLGETPIAPPRRKRSSVIDRQPVGFKELFGNNVSRRSSCDSILKDENPLTEREQEILQQKRKSKSISDFNLNEIKTTDSLSISTIRIPVTRTLSLMERAMVQQTTIPAPRPALQRKISRVGNKKSDKFFGENLSDCLSDDPITPEPEPTSISFTYHTISTLITPIPHSMQSIDVKDKLDEFVGANISTANDIDSNQMVYSSCIQPNEKISKPLTISECVDAKQVGDRKSSLDKKAEFLMAMLEGTNILPTSTATEENNKVVVTPPRRSHLKKKQDVQSNENGAAVGSNSSSNNTTESVTSITAITVANLNESNVLQLNQEKPAEKRSIDVNNKEFDSKTDTKVNVIIDLVDGNDDNEMYRGMTPVEEPIIVPRRRITKHICDGDDHIKKHVDNHNSHPSNAFNQSENKENEPNSSTNDMDVDQYIIMQVSQTSPEKPKRDFSSGTERSNQKRAEHSAPVTTTITNQSPVNKPVPATRVRTRHLSQGSLMPKTTSTPIDGVDPLETVLKKYTSQQSFFTQDLLNHLSDRIYGFHDDPFDPSETCDDGSAKYTPNSKLTTRKISAHRKESTVTSPILENDMLECENVDNAPKIVQMEQKEPRTTITMTALPPSSQPPPSSTIIINTETATESTPKSAIEQFILVERENSNVRNGGIEANVTIKQAPVTVAAILTKNSHKMSNNSTNSNESESKSNNANTSSGIVMVPLAPLAHTEDTSLEAGNSSDDENTDSDTTVKTALTKALHGDAKRDSIVDVDAWFLRHNDLSNHSRRCSESQVAYDTRKVFPFGRPEPGAGTAFFDTKVLSKSAENMLNDNKTTKFQQGTAATTTASVPLDPNEIISNETSASTTDHSILLKYLK